MMVLYGVGLAVHILAGAVALAIFWLPLVARKGGRLHRRVGWAYVVAACVVALSGFVVCARLINDPRPFRHRAGVFLVYIGLLAGTSALHGVRALRTKHRTEALRSPVDLVPAALLVIGGVALAAFGMHEAMVLYVLFAALGVSVGVSRLRFWLAPPSSRHAWFLAHMGGMGVSCITTVTAFVVVNAHRLGLHTFNLALWITPPLVGALGLTIWTRIYR